MESVARRVLHGERGTPVEARLFREELLPDWYDDWVIVERERLRQLCLNALERIGASLRRGGDVALTIDSALAAVQSEPLRESAYRALIEVASPEEQLDGGPAQQPVMTPAAGGHLGPFARRQVGHRHRPAHDPHPHGDTECRRQRVSTPYQDDLPRARRKCRSRAF